MQTLTAQTDRRTTTDVVFDYLHEAIVSLELPPGSKLSEAVIAKQFGVSRQPVRDAFNKLETQGLLLIRPQKATTVRGFSMAEITHARFIRLAVELEVIRNACLLWKPAYSDRLRANLEQQKIAVDHNQKIEFRRLDYDFHSLICDFAETPLAFETIQEYKRKIDRACVLSLERDDEAGTLLTDHQQIADALGAQDSDRASALIRRHIGRLDAPLAAIREKHAEYFE
jgi:DNA-binding GntR family transcriptional regulator